MKTFSKSKLIGLVHSVVVPTRDLLLVDLTSKALRKLGIAPAVMTASEKSHYPISREWAEAIHANHPDFDGIYWMSKQDNTQPALVLFGDRVRPADLKLHGATRSLLGDDAAYAALLVVAAQLGVNITP